MKHSTRYILTIALSLLPILVSSRAFAHCDGMDGPVVRAAQKALETGNINLVLIWVQEKDEALISDAFRRTLAVRNLSPEAKDFADMYFFETVVRIHRTGEGAAYTGLKPAGRDLGPAIPAADKALEDGSTEALRTLLTDAMEAGLHRLFHEVMQKKDFQKDDVASGREYVSAYVEFIHYVERLYEDTKTPVQGHFDEMHQVGMQNESH